MTAANFVVITDGRGCPYIAISCHKILIKTLPSWVQNLFVYSLNRNDVSTTSID